MSHHLPFGEERFPTGKEYQSSCAMTSFELSELFPNIIGECEEMRHALNTIKKIAPTQTPVLIQGESGTGKELFAAAIHRLSKRASKKMVAINCSAIPEDLLEAELFGYEKGAFTGAVRNRAGYFQVASGSTLFLDEIGEMPLRLQAKILRVLQEKTFSPLGSPEVLHTDARIVAATNVNLLEAIQSKSFRLDLYHRLNVVSINLPPLRRRGEDLKVLIRHILDKVNRAHSAHAPKSMPKKLYDLLCQYEWPGNIRELQNTIERAVLLTDSQTISEATLPDEIKEHLHTSPPPTPLSPPVMVASSPPHGEPPKTVPSENSENGIHQPVFDADFRLASYIESIENRLILDALKQHDFNKQKTAKFLGINRTTLVEKIKKRRLVAPTGDAVR